MNKGVKRIVIIALLLVSCARADWKDLKAGLDPKTAGELVGAPLFENRTRGGTMVNWVFDNGGFILFENGRVKFWQAPRDAKRGAAGAAKAKGTMRSA